MSRGGVEQDGAMKEAVRLVGHYKSDLREYLGGSNDVVETQDALLHFLEKAGTNMPLQQVLHVRSTQLCKELKRLPLDEHVLMAEVQLAEKVAQMFEGSQKGAKCVWSRPEHVAGLISQAQSQIAVLLQKPLLAGMAQLFQLAATEGGESLFAEPALQQPMTDFFHHACSHLATATPTFAQVCCAWSCSRI